MIIKIICGGEDSFSSLYSFDDNEYIIAVDAGIEVVKKQQLIADIAIGDFDSCNIDEYKNYYKEKITYSPVKDESDLALALNEAVKLNFEKIIIYNATGGRFDHFYANVLLLSKYSNYNIEMIDKQNKIAVIEKESEVMFDERYKYISFFALEDAIITLKGFVYEIEDYLLLTKDPLCLSNQIKDKGKILINNKKVLVIRSN